MSLSSLTTTCPCAIKSKSSKAEFNGFSWLFMTVFCRIGMLEECIFYLKQSIALVSDPKFYKSKRISMRNRRVN